MAGSILKIHTQNGDIPIGYPGLADKPISDKTLSKEGAFADSKVVGDKFKEVKTETDSLKEDVGNLSSSKISKFYATNNGENHLADSDDGKIADMMVYGRNEQKQYAGYQLFDCGSEPIIKTNQYNFDSNTGKYKCVSQEEYNANRWKVSVKKNTDMVFSLSSATTGSIVEISRIIQENKNDTFVYKINSSSKTVTFNTGDYDSITISIYCAYVGEYMIEGIMLEKGSEATSYEPYTGGKSSPSPDYPQEIKSVVNPTVKVSNEDGTQFKTVTLPYTLNAIPVSSGGNITIGGQQYVSDYVDVEREKLVMMVSPVAVSDSGYGPGNNNSHQVLINKYIKNTTSDKIGIILCDKLRPASANDVWSGVADNIISDHNLVSNRITFRCTAKANDMDSALKFIKSCKIYIALAEPEEIDLTTEEITAFKALATYYPTTHINVTSEQLDGYTVFNYPISMANGWNYVKKQLNDNRDYIYDMDIQSAEAYVNSEYAVALIELEV